MSGMEESVRLLEEVQTDYQEVIRYAVLIIQQSLSRLTPSSHYNPCSHIRVRAVISYYHIVI